MNIDPLWTNVILFVTDYGDNPRCLLMRVQMGDKSDQVKGL